jgi:hypothetical protein
MEKMESDSILPFFYKMLRIALIAAACGVAAFLYFKSPILEIYNPPETFGRRRGELTANISGKAFLLTNTLRYSVNGEEWIDIRREYPRSEKPYFTIEIEGKTLFEGENTVHIEANAPLRKKTLEHVTFTYDPSVIPDSLSVDWSEKPLDVQEGRWDTIQVQNEFRVRPSPGHEAYERILLVCGAFPGSRRVETDVTFREAIGQKAFGFGVIPLWGGHPDERGYRPRRGWIYGLGWYYSRHDGTGVEFSTKYGPEQRTDLMKYKTYRIQPDVRYTVIVEGIQNTDAEKNHRSYTLRMKWWPSGEPEPKNWFELSDCEGVSLPEQEYAVALLAHFCQVEFGSVRIKRLSY